MKTIFSIDRFEGSIAVCVSDDDLQWEIPREDLGSLAVHDVFSAEITEEGHLANVTPMPEERDRRLASNKARLQALLNRSKGDK